jgi:hypothetical protein
MAQPLPIPEALRYLVVLNVEYRVLIYLHCICDNPSRPGDAGMVVRTWECCDIPIQLLPQCDWGPVPVAQVSGDGSRLQGVPACSAGTDQHAILNVQHDQIAQCFRDRERLCHAGSSEVVEVLERTRPILFTQVK